MDIKILGLIAGFFTSVGFVPQIIKGFKTKKMKDVALWQYILTFIGITLWLIYGAIIKDIPLIASNAFSLVCVTTVLSLRIIYRNN
ncbi:MAG TPA: SemiSWEET transporter [Candidatus Goldiibacteriota bacterium]|nr:SemiSWEET transporter [Candidatus Goldiibacteriota bacterium]HPI03004.1 SemiSWEET transporter [Candidatus Goldiibacteriota bacterium]HPN64736.1 SemiSWEET transporter [Candidatus Goldiibacteriota bacterium]HRQ44228.1 SemiSWEET transporter [Candidatus Goldiibacteriota bacterium]